MIEKISAVNPATTSPTIKERSVSYDIHNISPNEMDALTLAMFKRGEISLSERLPFIPVDTKRMGQAAGEEVLFHYYSRVWDDPDRRRDMMREFKSILQDQTQDNDSQMNIHATKDALSLLERLEPNQSFDSVLKESIAKNT